jgi:catechol-2,3-dioxygenase
MSFLVHALGHVQINVRDPEAVIKDANEILGLHVTHRGGDQTWLSSNGRAAELVLRHSDDNSAHLIGLEALTAEAVDAAASRVEAAGCRVLSRQPSLD